MNNLQNLTFILNDREGFLINLKQIDDVIHCCYLTNISLYIHIEKIIIGKSIIIDLVEGLKDKLILTLSNKFELHDSIDKNIGYYWNQYLHEENPNLFFNLSDNKKEVKSWIGSQYLLWTTDSSKKNKQYATWLYNDINGNIIFEVTPIYPEEYVDWDDLDEMQAYQEWMKTYEPFFTRIIPKDIAMQWLDQANFILKTIDNNVEMLSKEN